MMNILFSFRGFRDFITDSLGDKNEIELDAFIEYMQNVNVIDLLKLCIHDENLY